jgi:hypothetical protein
VIPASTFAQQLLTTIQETNSSTDTLEEPAMSPQELQHWMKEFGELDEDD